MTRPRNIFPGWLCYVLVSVGIIAMAASIFAGCKSLDRAVDRVKVATTQPDIVITAKSIDVITGTPFATIAVGLLGAFAAGYFKVRQWQTEKAGNEVVTSVDDLLSEANRNTLKSRQSPAAKRFVTKAKGGG